MTRDRFLAGLVGLLGIPLLAAVFGRASGEQEPSDTQPIVPLQKRSSDWKSLVPPAAYRVLFEEATEPPFTSPLNDEKHSGTFICAACYLPLFDARTKYNSGTGWPSFYAALPDGSAPNATSAWGCRARNITASAVAAIRATSSATVRLLPGSAIATTAWRLCSSPPEPRCRRCAANRSLSPSLAAGCGRIGPTSLTSA